MLQHVYINNISPHLHFHFPQSVNAAKTVVGKLSCLCQEVVSHLRFRDSGRHTALSLLHFFPFAVSNARKYLCVCVLLLRRLPFCFNVFQYKLICMLFCACCVSTWLFCCLHFTVETPHRQVAVVVSIAATRLRTLFVGHFGCLCSRLRLQRYQLTAIQQVQ